MVLAPAGHCRALEYADPLAVAQAPYHASGGGGAAFRAGVDRLCHYHYLFHGFLNIRSSARALRSRF